MKIDPTIVKGEDALRAGIDAWAGYDATAIRTFLEELAAGSDHTASDVDVSYLLVLCAAYLVYEFANDDEEWEDYLQAVEDDILFPDGGNKAQPSNPSELGCSHSSSTP